MKSKANTSKNYSYGKAKSKKNESCPQNRGFVRVDILAYILGVIAALVIAAGSMLYGHSRSPAIWVFGIGAVIAVIGACCFWQDAEWKRSVEEKVPIDNNNSTASTGGVNASNNQGNINTGSVSGNLSQTVNVAPPQRRLSEEQLAAFIEELKPFAADANLRIFCTTTDTESAIFSKQIVGAIKASGIKPKEEIWGQAFGTGPLAGVQVGLRDREAIPPLAYALMRTLKSSGIPVKGVLNPDWPETDSNRVELNIYPNPNTK